MKDLLIDFVFYATGAGDVVTPGAGSVPGHKRRCIEHSEGSGDKRRGAVKRCWRRYLSLNNYFII